MYSGPSVPVRIQTMTNAHIQHLTLPHGHGQSAQRSTDTGRRHCR